MVFEDLSIHNILEYYTYEMVLARLQEVRAVVKCRITCGRVWKFFRSPEARFWRTFVG